MFEELQNEREKVSAISNLAEVGLECRESSILKDTGCLLCSWGLAQGDLPHQSPGAGLRSPCPGGFVSLLQENMEAGDYKAL